MDKVVYLLGAGVTQSEIKFVGIESDVTVAGINKSILEMSRKSRGSYYNLLQSFGIPKDQDVELIISLFEGYINKKSTLTSDVYKELRKLYRNCLISQINRKKITPRILSTLLYLDKNFRKYMGETGERIIGILTTNYDSLTEEAFSLVYGGVNYGYKFDSDNYRMVNTIFPLLRLHGSFNWKIKNGKLEVSKSFGKTKRDDNYSGWIPPSVYKRPHEYGKIFSEIWDKAQKVLVKCDILRVVGCSLRNEDWSLISLIFNSQIASKPVFDIELIVPDEDATGGESGNQLAIMQRLKFLGKVKSLYSLPIFDRGDVVGNNVFYYWLDKKLGKAKQKNSKIMSDSFINKMFFGGE